MREQPLIFLSYARKNTRLINIVENILQEADFQPWLDRQKLVGGQHWADEIQIAIDNCNAFILLLTPASLKSEAVQREYRYALEKKKPITLLCYNLKGPLPVELTNLPAIRYQKNRDRQTYALIDALDRLGIQSEFSDTQFNFHLALSRGYSHRLPEDWYAFFVPHSTYARLLPVELLSAVISAILVFLSITLSLNPFSILPFVLSLLSVVIPTYYVNRIYRIFRQVLNYDLPESLVVTPKGFVMRKIRAFNNRQFNVNRYPFAGIGMIEPKRGIAGTDLLSLDALNIVQKHYSVAINRRWGNSKAIAEQIISMFHHYQQAKIPQHSEASSQTIMNIRPHTPVVPTQQPMLSPSLASPVICVLATRPDNGFIKRLQKGLVGRQCEIAVSWRYPQRNTTLQTVIDSSVVIMLILSHASLKSADLLQQYYYALGQGKKVIPLFTQHPNQLPENLKNLQWIDCSDMSRWEYHMADILIALAATGITLPQGTFDGELTVAQALRGQLPEGSSVSIVPTHKILPVLMFIGCINAFIMLSISIYNLNIFVSSLAGVFANHEYSHLLRTILNFGIALGIWILLIIIIRRISAASRLERQKVIPGMIVVTSRGIAMHFPEQSYFNRRAETKSYPFERFDGITVFPGVKTVSALGMKDKATGKVVKIHLTRGFPYVNAIAATAIDAFMVYRRSQ